LSEEEEEKHFITNYWFDVYILFPTSSETHRRRRKEKEKE